MDNGRSSGASVRLLTPRQELGILSEIPGRSRGNSCRQGVLQHSQRRNSDVTLNVFDGTVIAGITRSVVCDSFTLRCDPAVTRRDGHLAEPMEPRWPAVLDTGFGGFGDEHLGRWLLIRRDSGAGKKVVGSPILTIRAVNLITLALVTRGRSRITAVSTR